MENIKMVPYDEINIQFITRAIPKFLILFGLSSNAKILHYLMLERVRLSISNHWIDEKTGMYYIKYKFTEMAKDLQVSPNTARKAKKELIEKGFLKERRIGNKKYNIYFLFLPINALL